MRKRKVTADQFRDIVRARITKGDAFRMDNVRYTASQELTKKMLKALSIKDIIATYPYAVIDITTGETE